MRKRLHEILPEKGWWSKESGSWDLKFFGSCGAAPRYNNTPDNMTQAQGRNPLNIGRRKPIHPYIHLLIVPPFI